MKHKKIFAASLVAIIAAAAVISLAQTSYASEEVNSSRTSNQVFGRHGRNGSGTMNKANGEISQNNSTWEADRLKRQQAIDVAMSANDYNAWLAVVGTSSPVASKITASNFTKLVQAHELRKQADAIMTELGIDRGNGLGMYGLQHK